MRTKFRFSLTSLLSLMILFPPIIAQSIGNEVKLAKQIRTRGLFDGTDFNSDTSANGAQQSLESTVQLAELSNQLRDLIGQFKLSENGKIPSQESADAETESAVIPTGPTLETEACALPADVFWRDK